MISIIPEGFNDFHCKAGSCRHTCCQTWEIDIDEDTADLYRSQPGPLGDDLRASLETGEDGVTHIRLNEKGFCPLLDQDGLCRVIKELGDECLSDICAVHPRFFTELDDYVLCGTGLCCEKSCELLAEQPNPLRFAVEDSDEVLTFPELVAKAGWEEVPPELLRFVPRTSREECAKIIDNLLPTEPIDEAWTQEMLWLREHLDEVSAAAAAYAKDYPDDLFQKLYQFILYRQLDRAADYGFDAGAEYAEQSTGYIFLEAALHGDPLEQARVWSEQIEYDTDNVPLLFREILEAE
ncbi:flagellin lysine-N-methylase [uncultured Acidaminococcus sp.]|uniref:flagellin lysine-N-methylase n=1 Tax=uncultured Acidaminococcus sp. TaxID=352152 RepID=UPI002593538A|nr:flagellin lysine-N-methylase [uncultured Acidaminococcus sp.]